MRIPVPGFNDAPGERPIVFITVRECDARELLRQCDESESDACALLADLIREAIHRGEEEV